MRAKPISFSSRQTDASSAPSRSIAFATIGIEAQQTIDQLGAEGRLPFNLTVKKVVAEGAYFAVHFAESNLPIITFRWQDGEAFRVQFRTAVLKRVPPAHLFVR